MVAQGIVKVLKDATDVPWDGALPAAVLVARKDFVEENPDLVEAFLVAHKESIDFINDNKEETVGIVSKQIKAITDQEIDQEVVTNALNRVIYTDKMDKGIMQEFANLSKELGFIEGDASLENLFE